MANRGASPSPGKRRSTNNDLVDEPIPEKFLEVRVQALNRMPGLVALCAGYESGEWRSRQLVHHMMEWLPDFALTYEERRSFGAQNAVRRMRKAARAVYTSKRFQK